MHMNLELWIQFIFFRTQEEVKLEIYIKGILFINKVMLKAEQNGIKSDVAGEAGKRRIRSENGPELMEVSTKSPPPPSSLWERQLGSNSEYCWLFHSMPFPFSSCHVIQAEICSTFHKHRKARLALPACLITITAGALLPFLNAERDNVASSYQSTVNVCILELLSCWSTGYLPIWQHFQFWLQWLTWPSIKWLVITPNHFLQGCCSCYVLSWSTDSSPPPPFSSSWTRGVKTQDPGARAGLQSA